MSYSKIISAFALGLTALAIGSCKSDDEPASGTASLLPEVPGALGKDNPPELGPRIDRAGRPAITAALIATFNPDVDALIAERDDYNQSEPGDEAFRDTVEASLAILDGLDEDCGNQLLAGDGPGRYATLAGALLDDQLYVRSDRPGRGSVYLGVEAEAVNAISAPQGSAGGRAPGDDVVARSYSVLAAGAFSGVDDGVPADDATHDRDVFPFLAAP